MIAVVGPNITGDEDGNFGNFGKMKNFSFSEFSELVLGSPLVLKSGFRHCISFAAGTIRKKEGREWKKGETSFESFSFFFSDF